MWGLVALVIIVLLVGCAFALGDGSTARVNTNAEADVKPQVSTDLSTPDERKKR